MKKITIIGATGKLAIPTIRRIIEIGMAVTAVVRNMDKAKKVLPPEVNLIEANLEDVDSLKNALQATEYLYLNLSHPGPGATFFPEIQGIENILTATKNTKLKQILIISGLGALHPEFNIKGEEYVSNTVRKKGFATLRNSGINYTILHATWFINSLPWFVKDGAITVYGDIKYPLYWTNTSDFADQLTNAIGNPKAFNKEYAIQGNEGMDFNQAAARFAKLFNPELKVQILPIVPEMGGFGDLLAYFNNFKEEFAAQQTFEDLGEPKTSFEDFVSSVLL